MNMSDLCSSSACRSPDSIDCNVQGPACSSIAQKSLVLSVTEFVSYVVTFRHKGCDVSHDSD